MFGLSGALDAARMAAFVAMKSGYSAESVSAMVLGGHGDAMVPLPKYTSVNGIPIGELLDDVTIERIIERTRQGGAEILALKKTAVPIMHRPLRLSEWLMLSAMTAAQLFPVLRYWKVSMGNNKLLWACLWYSARGELNELLSSPLLPTRRRG